MGDAQDLGGIGAQQLLVEGADVLEDSVNVFGTFGVLNGGSEEVVAQSKSDDITANVEAFIRSHKSE